MRKFRYSTYDLKKGIAKLLLEDRAKAVKAMKDVGMMLQREARLRAPIDEGNLQNSITNDVKEYGKSVAAVVYVPQNTAARDYAVWIHEGTYNLGKNSIAKQAKVGVQVGRKFITRAVYDNAVKFRRMIEKVLAK